MRLFNMFKYQITLNHLVLSTALIRILLASLAATLLAMSLWVESSLTWFLFNKAGLTTSKWVISCITFTTSGLLIADSILACVRLHTNSRIVKILCKIFLSKRFILWVPIILVFLYLSYAACLLAAYDNKLDSIITTVFYLILTISSFLAMINESIIANNSVKG